MLHQVIAHPPARHSNSSTITPRVLHSSSIRALVHPMHACLLRFESSHVRRMSSQSASASVAVRSHSSFAAAHRLNRKKSSSTELLSLEYIGDGGGEDEVEALLAGALL